MNNKNVVKISVLVKLITISLILVILPLTLFGAIGITSFSKDLKTESIDAMGATAKAKVDMLNIALTEAKSIAYSSASESNAISMLSMISKGEDKNSESDFKAIQRYVSTYLKDIFDHNDGMFDNIMYVNSLGIIVADGIGGASVGTDLNGADSYETAKKTGDVSIGDVMQSPITKRPVVVVSVPLFDVNKTYIGMFEAAIEFDKLTEILLSKAEGDKTNYAIMNDKGIIIAHSIKDYIFNLDLSKVNDSTRNILEMIKLGKPGYGYYELKGERKIMSFAPVDGVSWYVITYLPINDLMQPIYQMIWKMILMGLLFVVAAAIGAILFGRSFSIPIKRLSDAINVVSSGDLTYKVQISKTKDEVELLGVNFTQMIENLKELIIKTKEMGESVAAASQEMLDSSEEVKTVTGHISLAVADLAMGATEQAASTDRGNSMITEVVNGLNHITREMSNSEKLADKAKDTVEVGKESVQFQSIKMRENKEVAANVSDAIFLLSNKSVEIGEILTDIKSIADQTNLLSLNASIEAARAGEQGRGFAVVAEEIRKLAEQSNHSLTKIDNIIKEVQSGVADAVEEMNKVQVVVNEQEGALTNTVNAFERISKVVAEIHGNTRGVAEVSNQISEQSKQAGGIVGQIAVISQETAAGTEEVSASAEQQTMVMHHIAESAGHLSTLANELRESINRFKV